MKRILLFIFLLTGFYIISAQVPQKMSYQAVIRNSSNQLVANQTIGVEISIMQYSPNGLPVYIETHTPTTNANGLISIEIGTGTPCVGCSFQYIDWSAGPYYLKMGTDLRGGQNYNVSGSQQILSIPYALYAKEAESVDFQNITNRPTGQNGGDILYWNANSQTWDVLPVGLPGQYLIVGNNGTLAWNTMYVDSSQFDHVVPTVRTHPVTDVHAFYGIGNGEITDVGQSGIIAAGICWSLNPHPLVGGNHTASVIGFGHFSGMMGDSMEGYSKLLPDTVYYVRAYATNTQGTGYGEQVTFRTRDGIITLSTEDIANLNCTTLCSNIAGIDIHTAGGARITDCGIVYSNKTHFGTSYRPVPASHTTTNTITGTYYFISGGQVDTIAYYQALSNLFYPQSEYEVYAFAKNRTATCTYYGDKKTFKTPYRVGDYFNRVVNGELVQGIIFEVTPDQQHGKMIMLDEVPLKWRTTHNYTAEGTTNLTNGMANENIILNAYGSGISNYPAFNYCYTKHSDHLWYLPALHELRSIHTNFANINAILTTYGTPISYSSDSRTNRYWTSTEPTGPLAPTNAYSYKFYYSTEAPTDKVNANEGNPTYNVFVRCIRTF